MGPVVRGCLWRWAGGYFACGWQGFWMGCTLQCMPLLAPLLLHTCRPALVSLRTQPSHPTHSQLPTLKDGAAVRQHGEHGVLIQEGDGHVQPGQLLNQPFVPLEQGAALFLRGGAGRGEGGERAQESSVLMQNYPGSETYRQRVVVIITHDGLFSS